MKKVLWFVLPALAMPAFALSACHKDNEAALTSASDSMTSDASSVTPGDGVPALSVDSAASDTADAAPGTDATTYLAKAGAGDLFEIESSRAILKTTQNPQIKSFAEMMIKDHESSTAMLKKAAKSESINAPTPKLTADQQQTLDSIKAAKGADADKIYLGAQREGHGAALSLHKTYAANGNSAALKDAAAKIVPVVQHHITMLDKIGQ